MVYNIQYYKIFKYEFNLIDDIIVIIFSEFINTKIIIN